MATVYRDRRADMIVLRRGLLAAACAVLLVSLPGPVSAATYTVPSAIKADCSADVTAALNEWIASVPNGIAPTPNVLEFGQAKCYRVDGTLIIDDRKLLEFRGNGSTIDQHFVDGDPGRQAWRVVKGNDLTWQGFTVVGPHTLKAGVGDRAHAYGWCKYDPSKSCEWQFAWELQGVQRVKLLNNTSRDTYGDSVEISWARDLSRDSTDVLISGHTVAGTGRMGISMISGRNVRILDSTIAGAALQLIDIEVERSDNMFPVDDVEIRGNKLGATLGGVSLGTGICTDITNVTFADNEWTDWNTSFMENIVVYRPSCGAPKRGPYTITGNKFWVDDFGGWDKDRVVHLAGTNGVKFENNVVRYTCAGGSRVLGEPYCEIKPGVEAVKLNAPTVGMTIKNNVLNGYDTVWAQDEVAYGGTGVTACGNTTAKGTNQPQPCPTPEPSPCTFE